MHTINWLNFALFSIAKIKGESSMLLYIENNTKGIQRCMNLIVQVNPINICLHIAIKLFMVDTKLFFWIFESVRRRITTFGWLLFTLLCLFLFCTRKCLPEYDEVLNKESLRLHTAHQEKCNLSLLGKFYADYFYFVFTFTQNALEFVHQKWSL